jgi:hypothetical protein
MQGFMIEKLDGPVKNLVVRNNVIKAFRLLNVWDCGSVIIVNNSFKSELFYREGSNYGIELHNSSNGKIKNNLFYDVGQHTSPYLWYDSISKLGLDVGYNCHYMSDGSPPRGSAQPNDLWQIDPKLVNVLGNNFHLQPSSPLINAGMVLNEVTDDFDGRLRPQGNGYDIGGFQYQSVKLSSPRSFKVVP